MPRCSGEPDRWELEALHDFGITLEDLERASTGDKTGVRRPARIAIRNSEISGGVDENGPYIRLVFDLPRGSFATTLLREVMKNDEAAGEDGDDED